MNNDINQNKQNKQNNQNTQSIQNVRNNQNNQNNGENQKPPSQNMPRQIIRQNPSNPPPALPNRTGPAQSKSQLQPFQPPQKNSPVPSVRKPAPPVPTSGSPNRNVKTVKNANMADEPPVESGHTRTFDTNSDIKISNKNRERVRENKPPADKNAQNKDGMYHYTGRNIKSSRQMFVDTNAKTSKNKYDDDEGLSVSKSREKNKHKDDAEETKRSGFIMSGIIKVLLYIIGVLLVSIIAAYNIIMVANDVFAFVKTPVVVDVNIPENADVEKISEILFENELIKYPKIFNLYISFRKKDKAWNAAIEEYVAAEFEPGIYSVSSELNYEEFIYTFKKKPGKREEVKIVIPEGWTIDQIIDLFESYGIGSRDKFVEVINEYDFAKYGYRFLKPLYETILSPERKYKLEGYLFPDTYYFYKDESEVNVIMKLLNNFDVKFTEKLYDKCKILDMSIDEIVTLASMIEREGKRLDDFPKISAVFHNRLVNKRDFPFLQSDATKLYDYKEHKSDLTMADLEVDSPYNTYTREGLPPSAICNPGYEAITAALWPEENSPYYYFIARPNGTVLYSETNYQHELYREQVRKEKAQLAKEAAAAAAAAQEP